MCLHAPPPPLPLCRSSSSQAASLTASCQQCTSQAACPSPLAAITSLCQASPTLAQCSGYLGMCREAGATFTTLCPASLLSTASGTAASNGSSGSGGSGSSGSSSSGGDTTSGGSAAVEPPMKLYLHASMSGG